MGSPTLTIPQVNHPLALLKIKIIRAKKIEKSLMNGRRKKRVKI